MPSEFIRGCFAVLWFSALVVWSSASLLNHFGSKRVGSLKQDLVDHVVGKGAFVNINGGWARVLGRRRCNEAIRLKDGNPCLTKAKTPPLAILNGIHALSENLSRCNIPLFVVLCPQRTLLDESTGYGDWPPLHYNWIFDRWVSFLDQSGVDYLDFRPRFCRTRESSSNAFFRSDIHWNYDAAFAAYSELAFRLVRLAGSPIERDALNSDFGHWQRKTLSRGCCGSIGRRTGVLFCGYDRDAGYYDYVSQTRISKSIPKLLKFEFGSFADAVAVQSVLQAPSDLFSDRFFDYYENGLLPFVRYRNPSALCKKKVLFVKDSFGMPVAAMASTLFQAVDVIDPRTYSNMDLCGYILATEPDLVCCMFNASTDNLANNLSFWDGSQYFGGTDIPIWTECETISDFRTEAKSSARNRKHVFDVFPVSNAIYRVSFSNVKVANGSSRALTVALVDTSMKKEIQLDTFSIDPSLGEPLVFPFGPLDPSRHYVVWVYSGERDHTGGVSMEIERISLERMPGSN